MRPPAREARIRAAVIDSLRLAAREPVLLGIVVLAAVFFLYRWAIDPNRPGAISAHGWYGGFNQSSYLREAHLLGHLHSLPAEQFISGPGYPFLAAPLARSSDTGWPFHDPFFTVNLVVWLLTAATTFLVGRRLYGQLVGAAATLALMIGTPLIVFTVTPWNTTAVLGALMMTLLVGLARSIRWWHGFVLGIGVGLAYSARYVDALWVGGVALTILVARRAALRSPAQVAAGLLAGSLVLALPTFYLQWKAFGSPFESASTHSGVGSSQFHVGDIWPHAFQLFVSPLFLTNEHVQSDLSEPLLSSMFLLVFAPVGLAQTIRASSGSRRLLVSGTAASCFAAVLFYLAYYSTGSSGLSFGEDRFFTMWFPLWMLCGVWGVAVTFRTLARADWSRLLAGRRRLGLAWAAALVAAAVVAVAYETSANRLTPKGPNLSGSEENWLWGANSLLTGYCTNPTIASPDAVKSAVSTLVAIYRGNPTAVLGPGVMAGQTLTDAMNTFSSSLSCLPREAERLRRAIAYRSANRSARDRRDAEHRVSLQRAQPHLRVPDVEHQRDLIELLVETGAGTT